MLQARAVGQVPQHIIHSLQQLFIGVGKAMPLDNLGDIVYLVGDAGVATPACDAQRRWLGWQLVLELLQHDGQHLQGAMDCLEPARQAVRAQAGV